MPGCEICGRATACPLRAAKLAPAQRGTLPQGTHGILNVDKPAGMTSHDVVAAVRRMSHLSRVGHAGTLDPMATGVLLVCLGQATRVVEYLTDHDKKYHATIRLGVETDTYDATGQVVAERPVEVAQAQIDTALQALSGKIEQRPPAYSAIKQNGVPLYKLARRGVEVVTVPRSIEIYSLTLTRLELPDLELDVHCSKGTYIRSLAHDLGERLGCGAHLTALVRTQSGSFALQDSVSLDRLNEAFQNQFIDQFLSPLDEALLQFEAVILDPDVARSIRQGKPLFCGRSYSTSLLRAYSTGGELVALMEPGEASDEWKPKKVFLS